MSTKTTRGVSQPAHAALRVMPTEQHKGGHRRGDSLARTRPVDGPGLGTLLAAAGRQFHASLIEGERMANEEIDALFRRSGEQMRRRRSDEPAR
jgi:hypothetical protein